MRPSRNASPTAMAVMVAGTGEASWAHCAPPSVERHTLPRSPASTVCPSARISPANQLPL